MPSQARVPKRQRELDRSSARKSGYTAASIILVFAIMLRMPLFYNPVIWVDEQYYLLVGAEMLHGKLPFVDLWDRKPLGLFLIYAFAAMFGDGVIAYQLIALAASSATGLIIYQMAQPLADKSGALCAAALYILYLSAFHCFGGQSPVFYNLPVAWAAWQITRLITENKKPNILSVGCGIMLAIGVAIQIKYTVIFEGALFGITLLVLEVRSSGYRPKLLLNAILWVACAIAPTVAVSLFYAELGYWHAFFYANFESILYRQVFKSWWAEAGKSAVALAGPGIASYLAIRQARTPIDIKLTLFLSLWSLSAIFGFLLLGPYSDHYRAPLLVPLMTLGAAVFGFKGTRLIVVALATIIGAAMAVPRTLNNPVEGGTRSEVARATALILSQLNNQCLFMFDGDPVLYRTTHACIPTRFAFPQHLSGDEEVKALDTPPEQEVIRIMNKQPKVVLVYQETLTKNNPNAATRIFLPLLINNYKIVDKFTIGDRTYLIFKFVGFKSFR